MDVESRLRGAELPDVSVDTEAALSRTANRGRTARRRRVGLICTCAVLVAGGIAAAIVSIADGDSRTDLATGQSEEADTTSGTWRPLAPSPLTARDQGIAVWTGSAVVIAGGSDTTPCPADADCLVALSPLADGASYDPETDRWRLIADAPAPFVGGLATWTGTEVLVLAQQQFTSAPDLLFAYDPTTDRWDTRAAPPVDGFRSMAWTGDTWVGATATGPSDGSMWRYRPDTDTWEPITPDPLGPLSDRAVVWTGTELVVIGSRYGQPGRHTNGLWESAVLDVEGTWRRLPDSDIANNGGTWSPIDGLVANPGTGPSGGYDTGGVLDPTTGTWAPVPPHAPANGGATGYEGAAGSWIVAGSLAPRPRGRRMAGRRRPPRRRGPGGGRVDRERDHQLGRNERAHLGHARVGRLRPRLSTTQPPRRRSRGGQRGPRSPRADGVGRRTSGHRDGPGAGHRAGARRHGNGGGDRRDRQRRALRPDTAERHLPRGRPKRALPERQRGLRRRERRRGRRPRRRRRDRDVLASLSAEAARRDGGCPPQGCEGPGRRYPAHRSMTTCVRSPFAVAVIVSVDCPGFTRRLLVSPIRWRQRARHP